MANLFIVRTPMQLVSALEAMHHFQTRNNTLVMLHNRKKNNPKQMQKVIDIFDLHNVFDEIMEVGSSQSQSKFFRSLALITTLKHHHYDKFFLGLYDSMGKLFLANLSYEQSYLIDDGTATIVAHRRIIERMHHRSVGLKELRALFFGLHVHSDIPLHFFTLFQLQQHKNETIITHRFDYLKRLFPQQCERSGAIYLLGQNITDVPIISKEKYLCYIQQILEKYPHHEVIYIPHRSETLHPELYALQQGNLTIVPTTMPVELYFLINRIYPAHVISFFTSALYTLNILFEKSTIESFHIASEDIENHHSSVLQCQEFLQTTSVIHSPLQRFSDCKML